MGDDIDGEGLPIHILRAMGTKLVSRSVAIGFAELLLADRHGQTELDRQAPLQAAAEDDVRVIKGSYEPQAIENAPAGALRRCRIRIVISQFDGRVLDFAFIGAFPTLTSEGF